MAMPRPVFPLVASISVVTPGEIWPVMRVQGSRSWVENSVKSFASRLCLLDHLERYTVFDASARILHLQLGENPVQLRLQLGP